jgi:hypothetical protein
MPGASSGLVGVVQAARRRRQGALTRDAGFDTAPPNTALQAEPLEPDVTTPAELSRTYGASPSELSARYGAGEDEEPPFFIQHPYASAFLAGLGGSLSGRPGGGEEAIRTLQDARRQYRDQQQRALDRRLQEQHRQDLITREEARRRESLGVQLEDPSMIADPGLADAVAKKRQREETRYQEGVTRQEEGRNKPMAVSPEAGIWDPKEGKWIVEPRFRPQSPAGSAGQENARRDDAEKARTSIQKYKEASYSYRAQMQSIQRRVKASGGGKAWDQDETTGDGRPTGATYRERYEELKRNNDAAVGEINRLSGRVQDLQGEQSLPERTELPPAGTGAVQDVGGTIPTSHSSDDEVVAFLASQDPDLGTALKEATPEERAAWLKQWRAAQQASEGGEGGGAQ